MKDYSWLPYLHFCYLPGIEIRALFAMPARKQADAHEAVLLNVGERLLKQAICGSVEIGRAHVIPLSGGLDSRALLAGALEAGADVRTFTFGTPGTLDTDIGVAVAKAAGVPHVFVELDRRPVQTKELVDAVLGEGAKWTFVLDAYYNRLVHKIFGKDVIYLSGFLGGPLAGSHYFVDDPSWEAAAVRFAKAERFGRNLNLTPPGFNASKFLLSALKELPPHLAISKVEFLDFAVRQQYGIRPIVVHPNFDVRTPFGNTDWVDFILSVPDQMRIDQRLYKNILLRAWPKLFRMPTKNRYGHGLAAPMWREHLGRATIALEGLLRRARRHSKPRLFTNYLDHRDAFRQGGVLHSLVRENLHDLFARGVIDWLDVRQLVREHDLRTDLSRELLLLLNLEINLKAQDIQAGQDAAATSLT